MIKNANVDWDKKPKQGTNSVVTNGLIHNNPFTNTTEVIGVGDDTKEASGQQRTVDSGVSKASFSKKVQSLSSIECLISCIKGTSIKIFCFINLITFVRLMHQLYVIA